jgi:hypothetical protein
MRKRELDLWDLNLCELNLCDVDSQLLEARLVPLGSALGSESDKRTGNKLRPHFNGLPAEIRKTRPAQQ